MAAVNIPSPQIHEGAHSVCKFLWIYSAHDVCRRKWGSTGESGDDCAEVEDADSPTGLRQEPFQGLTDREGSRPAASRHGRHLQELP